MTDQDVPGHNRWHPDIPPVATVEAGDPFRVECVDALDGQVQPSQNMEDIKEADRSLVHPLSGPFAVTGAGPGDLLVVDILDIGALPASEWGYSAIFTKEEGGGFLTDYFPKTDKAVWEFDGIYCTSRRISGVRFAGIPHPGVIGCAPSSDLLAEWNRREAELVATEPDRVPALALPPEPRNAVLGSVRPGTPDYDRLAREAARTIPPREHGGNLDIKNLSRGSRGYFPVYIEGGNLSIGDLHFSQGDGEICLAGAIEMAGYVDLRVGLIKEGMDKYRISNPVFIPGPVEPRYSQYLTFTGFSIDDEGTQHYIDATLAFKRACP